MSSMSANIKTTQSPTAKKTCEEVAEEQDAWKDGRRLKTSATEVQEGHESEIETKECSQEDTRLSQEELFETWEENFRSFTIVVKLQGKIHREAPVPENWTLDEEVTNAVGAPLTVDGLQTNSHTPVNDSVSVKASCKAAGESGTIPSHTTTTSQTCERCSPAGCPSGTPEGDSGVTYQLGHDQRQDDLGAIYDFMARSADINTYREYKRLMQRACTYGSLMRETYDTRHWLRERIEQTDSLASCHPQAPVRRHRTKHLPSLSKLDLLQLKNLLDEVVEQEWLIESQLRASWDYLRHDPDTLLYVDVVETESAWQHLREKLRMLISPHISSWHRGHAVPCELAHSFETTKDHHQEKQRERPHQRQESRPQKRKRKSRTENLLHAASCDSFIFSAPFNASSSSDREENHSISFSFSRESLPVSLASSLFIPSAETINSGFISSHTFRKSQEDQYSFRKVPLKKKGGGSLPNLLSSCTSFPRRRKPIGLSYSKAYSDSVDGNSEIYIRFHNRDISHGRRDSTSFAVDTASEGNLLLSKPSFSLSVNNNDMEPLELHLSLPGLNGRSVVHSGRSSPRSGRSTPYSGRSTPQSGRMAPSSGRSSPLGVRPAHGIDDSPVVQKRRRLNGDGPNGCVDVQSTSADSSPRDSPASLHLMLYPGMSLAHQGGGAGSTRSTSFDDTFDDFSDSQLSSPEYSPSVVTPTEKKDRLRGKYRKHELWAAIRSDYHYLMDGEIIETCKSTESDLSLESDDLLSQTKVSFTEFMQQYKELTEWLNHIQMVTQRQGSSLSEKYLNQTYHEEMLQRSPRRKVFNDYAKQLMRRYPSMKDEINIRLQHLNGQWETLEKAISPGATTRDEQTMLRDLEQDLNGLRKWLHDVESRVLPLNVRAQWTKTELEEKLKEHQALQRDIESHSKIVSAVLKLCEHLQNDQNSCSNRSEKESLQVVAVNLERRWHAIWLQSLECQCWLEEAIANGKSSHPRSLNEPVDWGSRFGFSKTTTVNISTRYDDASLAESSQLSSADEELSELIDEEISLYSDHSNSDVIPFSENEYEKIVVDSDCCREVSEDGHNRDPSPGGSSASSKASAIDSALGRSVSDDHNIHSSVNCAASHQTAPPCITTSEQVSRAVQKAVSFAQTTTAIDTEGAVSGEMRATADRTASGRLHLKQRNQDVGYSSESCSNDDSIEHPRAVEDVVLRKDVAGSTADGGDLDPDKGPSSHGYTLSSPATSNKSWRHSMTSAYDTGSQCSDLNSPYDLDNTLDTSVAETSFCTTVDRSEGPETVSDDPECYGSSSSQNFYVMTTVDCDTDGASPLEVAPKLDISTGEDLAREGEAGTAQSTEDLVGAASPSVYEPAGRPEPIGDLLVSRSRRHPGSSRSTAADALPERSEHVAVSSCDASNECTDSEEDDEECSSSSNEDDCSIHSDGSLASQTFTDYGTGPTQFKSNTLPKARSSKRRFNNRDVTELYKLTHGLDFAPFSISESAIDSLSKRQMAEDAAAAADGSAPGSTIKLRRTISETRPLKRRHCAERLQRLHQKRKVRRSSSDDAETKPVSGGPSQLRSPRGCVSLPTSRQQSSQEWHSLSSPEKNPSNETLQQEWMAAAQYAEMAAIGASPPETRRQVETSELSESDAGEIPKKLFESDLDTEEAMLKSMNSTMESFSENAWDNYQDPPYHVTTDDPSEVKLDDSALPWEQSLEFEEEFHLMDEAAFRPGVGSTPGGPGKADCTEVKVRPRDKRISVSSSFHEMSQVDDSDSDLEELHHVISESRQQITVAESVLGRRHYREVANSGLAHDVSRYAELVATCRTNIRCLEVLNETLDSREASHLNVTECDLQEVQDIIRRWDKLHTLAVERHRQARELAEVMKEVCGVRTHLDEAAEELSLPDCRFADVKDLEHSIMDLQSRKLETHRLCSRVGDLQSVMHKFGADNPDVPIDVYLNQLDGLITSIENFSDRCSQRVSKLQSALFSWYDLNEMKEDLARRVDLDHKYLQSLALSDDTVIKSITDVFSCVQNIKTIKGDAEIYDRKLQSLRSLSVQVAPVLNEPTQAGVLHKLSTMEADITTLRSICDDIQGVLQEIGLNQGRCFRGVLADRFLQLGRKDWFLGPDVAPSADDESSWRALRMLVPVVVVVVVLLVLAYLHGADPLDSLRLVISPELRYVRGPPPV